MIKLEAELDTTVQLESPDAHRGAAKNGRGPTLAAFGGQNSGRPSDQSRCGGSERHVAEAVERHVQAVLSPGSREGGR